MNFIVSLALTIKSAVYILGFIITLLWVIYELWLSLKIGKK